MTRQPPQYGFFTILRSLLLPGFSLSFPLASVASEEPIQMLYDVRPPMLTLEGKRLGGSLGTRAQQALDRSGLTYQLVDVPVQRQLLSVERNLLPVCVVGRLMSEDRKQLGVFTRPIMTGEPYVAVTRSDFTPSPPLTLQNWAQQPTLRWGVQAGLYYSEFIQRQMTHSQASIQRFTAANQHFASLLKARRIDFFLIQHDEAMIMLSEDPSLKTVSLSDVTAGESRYFYCSKKVPAESIRALNSALPDSRTVKGLRP